MIKHSHFTLAPALALALAFLTPAAIAANLSVAEQPVRLIRAATVYKAAVGVTLQNDDIVETGAGSAQVEAGPGMLLALDPYTRIYLVNVNAGTRPEVVLLSGWVKLAAKARVAVSSPLMRVSLERGASIIHQGSDRTQMFAEDGSQLVAALDAKGQAGTEVKVEREQYALVQAGAAPKVLPRAPREFLRELPLTFQDPVTAAPDRLKGAKVAPVVEREAEFGDIAPWLTTNLSLHKRLMARFQVRLKDPRFRKQFEARLGTSAGASTSAPAAPPVAKPAAKVY